VQPRTVRKAALRELLASLPVLPERRDSIERDVRHLFMSRGDYEPTKPWLRIGGTKKALAQIKQLEQRVSKLRDHIKSMNWEAHREFTPRSKLLVLAEQLDELVPKDDSEPVRPIERALKQLEQRLKNGESLKPPKGKIFARFMTIEAHEVYTRLTGDTHTSRYTSDPINEKKLTPFHSFLKKLFRVMNIDAKGDHQARHLPRTRIRKRLKRENKNNAVSPL